jgi:hypothetical protein
MYLKNFVSTPIFVAHDQLTPKSRARFRGRKTMTVTYKPINKIKPSAAGNSATGVVVPT